MTYKSGFTAFDTINLRGLLASLDGDELPALLALCTFADASGVCFPGVRTIASISGRTIDATFKALNRLEVKGFLVLLRANQRDPITRQQLPDVYAINPQMLHISNELSGVSFITLPIITEKPDRYYASTPIHNQNQLNQNQLNQNQNQNHEPESAPKPSASGAGNAQKSFDGELQNAKSEGKRQRTAPPENTAQAEESTMFRRREPHTLKKYAAELPESSRETWAQNLRGAAADLSLPNCRMLVDVYGWEVVRIAIVEYGNRGEMPIVSPARWFRKVIRRLDGAAASSLEPAPRTYPEWVNT